MLSCAMAPNEVEPDGERWSGCFGDWGLRDVRAVAIHESNGLRMRTACMTVTRYGTLGCVTGVIP